MLVKMKKNAHDKNNKDNKLKVGDLVIVEDTKRAKAMIRKGMAEEVKPKTLAEPPKDEKEEVVKVDVSGESEAGAENKK